jgi:hypothetical protein
MPVAIISLLSLSIQVLADQQATAVSLPACTVAGCSGRRIDDSFGILRFCVPRSMKISKAVGEHGDLHYSVSFSTNKQHHTLYIVSGLYYPGKDPRGTDSRWVVRQWRCPELKIDDYRLNDSGRRTRYITLNAPMGYATYKDLPNNVADRFDQVLDSLCCGECKICQPKPHR